MGVFSDINKRKYLFSIAVIFIVSFYARVSVDGIYLDNPGNIKASDPVYHVLVSENIADTGLTGKIPAYMAQNHEDVVDVVPPYQSIAASPLIALGGLKSWNAYYLITCIFSALAVVLVYLITSFIFNEETGIIASGLLILPLAFNKWFYYLGIGMWTQNTIFTLVLFVIYLCLLYFDSKRPFLLVLIGMGNGAIYLLHFSELVLLLPVEIYLAYLIIKEEKMLIRIIKNYLIVTLPMLILLFSSYRVFFAKRVTDTPVFSGFHTNLDLPFFVTKLSDISWIYWIFIAFALLQLALNFKKYSKFNIYIIYYFIYCYILPYFFTSTYYLVRMRAYSLFLMVILVAYTIKNIILNQIKIQKYTFYFSIGFIFLFLLLGYNDYSSFVNTMKYQNIPTERYDSFEWINNNTDKQDIIFYFGLNDQGIDLFMKRHKYLVDLNRLQESFEGINLSNDFPMMLKGYWRSPPWSGLVYMKNLFENGEYPSQELPSSLLDFDYIYLENFHPNIKQLNEAYTDYLIKNYPFSVAKKNDFAIILKNEKKR